jgi:hypothetical protein
MRILDSNQRTKKRMCCGVVDELIANAAFGSTCWRVTTADVERYILNRQPSDNVLRRRLALSLQKGRIAGRPCSGPPPHDRRLGRLEEIEHRTLDGLEGSTYGTVAAIPSR